MQAYARGVYVNFMGEEDAGRVNEDYDPVKYSKLVGLKNKYDPANMFHLNQNIVPTTQKK